MISQLSIFMENKKGAMKELLEVLASENINILGYVTNDSAEYGIVRIITSDNSKAYDALLARGYLCKKSEVIGVQLEDTPGTMAELLQFLEHMNINIDYMYLGYSREANMPVTMIHCEFMDVVSDSLRHNGYTVY